MRMPHSLADSPPPLFKDCAPISCIGAARGREERPGEGAGPSWTIAPTGSQAREKRVRFNFFFMRKNGEGVKRSNVKRLR